MDEREEARRIALRVCRLAAQDYELALREAGLAIKRRDQVFRVAMLQLGWSVRDLARELGFGEAWLYEIRREPKDVALPARYTDKLHGALTLLDRANLREGA